MRPLRLEIEGFASFRERTCVDFEGADMFVLSGPMGAGKSSIIDAIGFALYGAIARYDDRRVVAPVINQQEQQARVLLNFRLGADEYTAVRVVRRTKTGASTPEARLLRGEDLLADTADQVTERVTDLLGLSFDQFTKCVVLPQGEFAELLHSKPGERQELLVRLLDIGYYRKIGERARRMQDRSAAGITLLRERLEGDLRNVTRDTYAEQEKRVKQLSKLHDRLEADEATLQELKETIDQMHSGIDAGTQLIAILEAIEVPATLGDLGERLRKAQAAATDSREVARAATDQVEKLQQARDALPERAKIDALIALHAESTALGDAIVDKQRRLENAQSHLARADVDVAEKRAAAEAAEAERNRIERAHSAYHASVDLKAGDRCPVCGEKLTAAPRLVEPSGLKQATAAFDDARRQQTVSEDGLRKVRESHASLVTLLAADEERRKKLAAQLKGQPSPSDCETLLTRIAAADRDLDAARERDRVARRDADTADAALKALAGEEQASWSRFNTARDPVAALGAPAATESIETSWQALAAWAVAEAQAKTSEKEVAVRAASAAEAQQRELLQTQAAACEKAGVELRGKRPRDVVIEERARAEAELKQIDLRLAERDGVERDLASSTESSRISGLLALHLRADHFERWYLQEAMQRLVRGATERLKELTNDQYAIELEEKKTDFVVLDRINGDERRPVRTLSGGETFLASLALALALGDDIAGFAANGAARLDALFLDEGFGSLDTNTLETVASAIEDLGARGRMVGIVTHVRELADRIPVQYLVSKSGGSSHVQRQDAR